MARNPYQLDPYFAQGLANLTTALIGNPETDYQTAGTNLRNVQANEITSLLPYRQDYFKAQTAAQNALSGKYGSEDAKLQQETIDLKDAATRLKTLSADPFFQSLVSSLVQAPEGVTVGNDAAAAFVGRMFEEGNVSDIANAFATIGEAQDFETARNKYLDPKTEINEKINLNAFLGNAPNKYSNPAFAGTELEKTLANNLEQKRIEGNTDQAVARINKESAIDVAQIQTTSAEEIASEKNKFQKGWEEYKADKAKEADIEVANIQDNIAQEKLKAEIQWEKENDIVIDDNLMVFSPEAAERYGITSKIDIGDNEKIFAIDTSKFDPSGREKVEVKVADDKIIYVDQQYINNFPIERVGNELVWKEGASTQTQSSKNQTANTIVVGENLTQAQNTNLTNDLKDKIPSALPELPASKQMALQQYIIGRVDKKMSNANSTLASAKQAIMNPILGQGTHTYNTGINLTANVTVPKFFHDKYTQQFNEARASGNQSTIDVLVENMTSMYATLGYNGDEIEAILTNFR